MKLKTSEPITIELKEESSDVIILVDNIEYALISNCEIEELDHELITEWVTNTYYEGDYKCNQYIPGTYDSEGFLKKDIDIYLNWDGESY